MKRIFSIFGVIIFLCGCTSAPAENTTTEPSLESCTRLEFVPGIRNDYDHHTYCLTGIADSDEIAAFFSDIRSQKTPEDAGLYDLITNPDGSLNNQYVYGTILASYGEQSSYVHSMKVTSYNDLAFSISIGQDEYVLPVSWLYKMLDSWFPDQIEVGTFSYEKDYTYYIDSSTTKTDGFACVEETEVIDYWHIVTLAKKEVHMDYNSICVDFDPESRMYRVHLSSSCWLDGDAAIYINEKGITQLIVLGG